MHFDDDGDDQFSERIVWNEFSGKKNRKPHRDLRRIREDRDRATRYSKQEWDYFYPNTRKPRRKLWEDEM